MMVLTLVVWVVMYVRRIRYMLSARVHPQKVRTPDKVAALIPEEINYPAHNLMNLFELPVLFYALCLYLYATGTVDLTHVITAWAFVGFRVLHSAVHCTTNHVMTRFRLYMLASLALWFMLGRAVLAALG